MDTKWINLEKCRLSDIGDAEIHWMDLGCGKLFDVIVELVKNRINDSDECWTVRVVKVIKPYNKGFVYKTGECYGVYRTHLFVDNKILA